VLGAREYDIIGLVLQGGYNIDLGQSSVEPFVRYEHLDFDDAITDAGGAEDEVDLLTFGVNWYLTKHATKLTADVVWALDPLPIKQEGLGLLAADGDEDGQVALRLQFQLLF
jgi:phosphate-selective porin